MSRVAPYPPTELRAMAARLLHIADMAEGIEEGSSFPSEKRSAFHFEKDELALAALAESEYQARRRREKLFTKELFGEPAWDMLLDIYVSRARRRRVSVTSLCIASCRPPTTALRWITLLQEQGLVFRDGSMADHRVCYIELSARGVKLMEQFLSYRMKALPSSLLLSVEHC